MRLQYASKLCCLCFPFGSGFMLPPLHACGKSLCFFPVLLLLRTRRQKWQTFSEKISKSFRQSIKTPAAFLYQSGVLRGVLSLVNRCFPCKMRGVFSGLPVTEKFFMDRLHLLDFLERGLRRFPVKNDTAAISRFYHVCIGIVSSLSAKHDIFPHGEKRKMPQWGSPAAAETEG